MENKYLLNEQNINQFLAQLKTELNIDYALTRMIESEGFNNQSFYLSTKYLDDKIFEAVLIFENADKNKYYLLLKYPPKFIKYSYRQDRLQEVENEMRKAKPLFLAFLERLKNR